MLTVLHVTLPVFALIACGWIAARRRLLTPEAAQGINVFVFIFALPAMLFRAVSGHPLDQIADLRFLAAYAGCALLMLLGSRLVARRHAPQQPTEHTAFAFAATHGNLGYLGLPLMAQLGESSRLPAMVMALLVDILLVIVLSIVLFEFARGPGTRAADRLLRLRSAIGGLLRTPLILGIALGLVFSIIPWPMPEPVDRFIGLLAAAAGPSALFAIGASLGERRIELARGVPEMVVLKLLVHPALVGLAMLALGVDSRLAAVGVLAAALPTASNTFILSQRYGADTRSIGSALALGTVLAVASVSAIIWLLGLVTP